LQVAEGVIEDIQVKFVNPEGEEIKGKTQKYIITREMQLKSGEIFRREVAQKDLQRVFGLGIFQDINLKLNPAEDPRKVVLVVNVTEARNFSVSPGGGYSSKSGLFAASSFNLRNLNGRNQRLGADVEFSQRDIGFDINYTDPWIAGDPYRTSYNVNGFRKRTFSQIFDGGETEVELANGDRPRVFKTGGNISFRRNLSKKVFEKSEWVASAGLKYQRVAIRDSDGDINAKDELGNDLSFSGDGTDDLLTVPLRLVRDKRNNLLSPTKGSVLSLSTEQSIPIGDASILSNKLSGSYSFYLPTRLTKLTEGCRKSNNKSQGCPQAFAFNLQAGTVIGDLPPYEAFSLGGANSVRGFGEGELGSARSFLQASAEYRFPVFSLLSGALFFDAATDLGTADSVTGNPAGARDKPGNGFGYGLGVRVKSPLGPIRLDYGYNNDGESRVQFGIGERF
jgi:outer membrane protein insertion porin family